MKTNYLLQLSVIFILVSFYNCSKNETEGLQIEEEANYGIIDAILASEEQFFLDALEKAKTIHELDSILSQQNTVRTRSAVTNMTNNEDLEMSDEEGQIFQEYIERYTNEIDFALDQSRMIKNRQTMRLN